MAWWRKRIESDAYAILQNWCRKYGERLSPSSMSLESVTRGSPDEKERKRKKKVSKRNLIPTWNLRERREVKWKIPLVQQREKKRKRGEKTIQIFPRAFTAFTKFFFSLFFPPSILSLSSQAGIWNGVMGYIRYPKKKKWRQRRTTIIFQPRILLWRREFERESIHILMVHNFLFFFFFYFILSI